MKRLAPPLLVLMLLTVIDYGWRTYGPTVQLPLPTTQIELVGKLLLAGIWFCMAWLIKRATEVIVGGATMGNDEKKIPKLVFELFGAVLFFGALLIVIGIVFEKPVAGLLTTSGIITGVIAFAIRDLIADVFSGIALAIERPAKTGDWLQFGDGTPPETGRVVEMNWRAVRMVTIQGRTLVFPNHQLARQSFVNLSLPERYFRTVKRIVVDFSVPPERSAEIIMSAIKATPGLVTSNPPRVLIDELNERGTVFSIHFWVPDYAQMFMLERKVMENVVHFLNQAGHSPAYPKLELDPSWRHMSGVEEDFDIVNILPRISLLSSLSHDELKRLATSLELVHRYEGDLIVSETDDGDSLFVIITGLVSVSKTVDGKSVELTLLRPGDFFGEMSLLTGMPRSADVTATTDCSLIEIRSRDLKPILEGNPKILDQLGNIQAKRMQDLSSINHMDAEEKAEIEEAGLSNYLKKRMSHFFGLDN